ncbi:MAG: glutamine amidotransferase [Clostridiales bacterium]|nr:glutamine amidotransferase [Clostridiales bacterium]MDU1042223.1 glutamine amidotransferase [Clostridiales bacterium]
MELKICHLYPEMLNLYGDRGNIYCMKKRLEWRGIYCRIDSLALGEQKSLNQYDLFFIGGGQDFEQEVLLSDLHAGKGEQIKQAIEDGKTFLTICGGYQMLGHYYENQSGVKCRYLGAVDFHTVAGSSRLINNYAFKLEKESGESIVVGYENHSGRTYLSKNVRPLGTIIKGNGNNGEDGTEGVRYKNVFGTYAHGPVLPKNPVFCDEILSTALERKYGSFSLDALSDKAERIAHDSVYEKIMSGEIG